MLDWASFLLLVFWLAAVALLASLQSFFSLLLGAEAVWAVLYALAALAALSGDDLNLFSLTFFVLGIAAAELALGVMLLVLLHLSGCSTSILARPRAGLNG